MSTIINQIKEKAKLLGKTIVLPESEDERVLKAAELIKREKIAKVILVGDEIRIKADAEKLGVNLTGIGIVNPRTFPKFDAYVAEFVKLREKKGMTEQVARQIMFTEPRFFGAMMVRMGDAMGW